VVNINTESSIKNPHHRRSVHPDPDQEEGGEEDNQFQDFFDKFFGGQGGQGGAEAGTIRQRSLGSGVIVDAKGYIVTNRHVVEKADRIRVKLQDETRLLPGHDAKLIGMDQETDLAVIKIEMDHPATGREAGQFRRHASGRLGAGHRQSLRTPGNCDRGLSRPRDATSFPTDSSSPLFRPMPPLTRAIPVDRW